MSSWYYLCQYSPKHSPGLTIDVLIRMVGELPGFPHHYLLERTVLDRTEQPGGQDTSLTNLLVSDNRYTSDY